LREALHTNNPSSINLTGITGELGKRYNDDPFQRVIFMDSHDSAANGSSRLNEVIAPGDADGLFARRQSLLAAALLLTAPGIPMLFQGQELMEVGSFNDWRGIDWERTERFSGIVQAYRELIALRRNLNNYSAGLLGASINIIQLDEE